VPHFASRSKPYDLWFDPGMKNVLEVSDLLKPFDADRMLLRGESPRQPRRERRRGVLLPWERSVPCWWNRNLPSPTFKPKRLTR
jgi:hypothetical protein